MFYMCMESLYFGYHAKALYYSFPLQNIQEKKICLTYQKRCEIVNFTF